MKHNTTRFGKRFQLITLIMVGTFGCTAGSTDLHAEQVRSLNLPLASVDALVYEGAFQLSQSMFGESNMKYAEGPIEYNPVNNSLFIVGHTYQQAIAEFPVPELVDSTDVSQIPMVQSPTQAFSRVLNRSVSGNNQSIDRIGGMRLIDGELFVNAYEYYDAAGDSTHTTLVIRNPGSLASSVVDGFYDLRGASHVSAWISEIPTQWQDALGGSYISGSSSGRPITSRLSVGPSAFIFDPADMARGTSLAGTVPTTTALDFSLENPLHDDLYNNSLNNDLWTHKSYAVYGFIIPNTRTYLTIGYSGGHESGIGYKVTQDNGQTCGGYCTRSAADNYNYYWAWNVDDLVMVKNGEMAAHAVRPYAYGKLPMPFQNSGLHRISGASFDIGSGRLFVSLDGAGSGERTPVIAVFRFDLTQIVRADPPQGLSAY